METPLKVKRNENTPQTGPKKNCPPTLKYQAKSCHHKCKSNPAIWEGNMANTQVYTLSMKKELEASRGGRELELVRSGRGYMKESVLDGH